MPLRARGARLALAATIAATGIAFVTTSGAAYATQFCAASGQSCLNAWGGGPAVNVESPGASDNTFQLQNFGGIYYQIQYINVGQYSSYCVGDYGNSQSSARAGLVSGCQNPTDWGVNYDTDTCNNGNGDYFNNIHWTDWLGPQSGVGSAFYLNKPSGWCFQFK
jgi:hypothetical protein